MSDEDIFGNVYLSDEYQPNSASESSSDEDLPAKRCRTQEVDNENKPCSSKDTSTVITNDPSTSVSIFRYKK